MTECLSIDFRPRGGALPRILRVIEDRGFALRGIRVIPAHGGERSTLRLDLCGSGAEDEFDGLADHIMTLEDALAFIHRAGPGATRPGSPPAPGHME